MTKTLTTTELKPGHKLLIDNYTGDTMTVQSVTESLPGMYTVTLLSHPGPGKEFKHQLVLIPADHEFTRK